MLAPALAAAGEPDSVLDQRIPPAWWDPEITAETQPTADVIHEPGVLYINFDGGQMQSCNGSNNPVNNCSTVMTDEVLPYSGGASQRAAVVQAMQVDTDAYALDVVDERPADEVQYDMVMVGDWNPPPDGGGFAGVAPTIDCWNMTRGETSFSLDYQNTGTVSAIVGQEAAHVWGLEHVDSDSDLLFPTIGGAADKSFEDTCHQIVVLSGGITPSEANCPEMHEANCPDQPDHQNSHKDLLMVFGPREPDILAPTLEILAPTEGEVIPSGEDFGLTIRMLDETPPPFFEVFMALDVDEQGMLIDTYKGPELTFPVKDLADGEHFIRVDITDAAGNPATASVAFVMGNPPATTGDDTSGSEATGAEDEGDAGTTGDEGDGTDTASGDDSSGGCGCSSSGSSAWALLVLAVLVARRRRARA